MDELAARVEALLRRPSDTRATTLQVGPLKLDLIARSASRGRRALDLLPAEFKLLEFLMRHFRPNGGGASSTCLAIRRTFVPFAVRLYALCGE